MRGEKTTYTCKSQDCGKGFVGYKSQPKKYCSAECYHRDIRNGNGTGPQRHKSFPIDLSIYEEYQGNIVIYECGCDDGDGVLRYTRHHHHFDYTSNLVLSLCPSCHKKWHVELHRRRLAATAVLTIQPKEAAMQGQG